MNETSNYLLEKIQGFKMIQTAKKMNAQFSLILFNHKEFEKF